MANEDEGLKIYERNGQIVDFGSKESNDTGNINLPKSNAYENEIRYFVGCAINDKQPDKVKPQELRKVIDILKSL